MQRASLETGTGAHASCAHPSHRKPCPQLIGSDEAPACGKELCRVEEDLEQGGRTARSPHACVCTKRSHSMIEAAEHFDAEVPSVCFIVCLELSSEELAGRLRPCLSSCGISGRHAKEHMSRCHTDYTETCPGLADPWCKHRPLSGESFSTSGYPEPATVTWQAARKNTLG